MSMILRNVATRLQTCSYQALRYCTAVVNEQASSEEIAPIISKRSYADEKFFYQKPREVWLENLDTVESKKIGLVALHPDVYGAAPRIDIIHQNVRWQRSYRFVVISIPCSLRPRIVSSKSHKAQKLTFHFSPTRIRKLVRK